MTTVYSYKILTVLTKRINTLRHQARRRLTEQREREERGGERVLII